MSIGTAEGLGHCLHSQVLIFLTLSLFLSGVGFVFPLFLYASLLPSLFLLSFEQEIFGSDKNLAFQLFGSPYGKDLLFTDATLGFLRVPPKMDAKLYLGYEYSAAIQHLRRGMQGPGRAAHRMGAIEAFLVPAGLTQPSLAWEPKGTTNCVGLMKGFSAELGKRPEF